jgi:tetratricopeptide (TPR) repeat protein
VTEEDAMRGGKNRWLYAILVAVFALGCGGKDKKIKGTTPPPGGGGEGGDDVEDPLATPKPRAKPKIKLTKKEKKSFGKAIKIYRELAKKAEKSGWESGMCRKAAKAFGAVAEDNPRLYAHAKYNEGTSWVHCGKTSRATSAFRAALGKNPRLAAAKVSLGYMASQRGQVATAYRMFEDAYRANPANPEASYNLGVIYREKAKAGKMTASERARITNLRSARGYPLYSGFLKKLARRGETLSYKNLAVRHLQTVLAVSSGSEEPAVQVLNLRAYTMLALVYLDASRKIRSQMMLAKLVINEANTSLKERRGLCRGGKPTPMDKAVAELRNVDGLIELRLKQLVKAMKQFTAAVRCNPDFIEAHMNIGAIALSFRGYKRAKDSFIVVLKHQPKNIDATMGLGVAYRGMSAAAMADDKDKLINMAEGQYKKAMALAGATSRVGADALYNLGLLYQDYKAADTDAANKKRMMDAVGYYTRYAAHPKAVRKAKNNAVTRKKDILHTIKVMDQMARLKATMAAQERRMKAMARKAAATRPRPTPPRKAPAPRTPRPR